MSERTSNCGRWAFGCRTADSKSLGRDSRRLVYVFLAVCMLASGVRLQAAGWRAARPDFPWSFPRDHWARDGYKTEWWYFTGHLQSVTAPTRHFGYQFTFFRLGILPTKPKLNSRWTAKDVIMGHAAVTDLDKGQHRFSELMVRAVPFLGGFGRYPDPVLVWSVGPAGTPENWKLRWNGKGFDISMMDRANSLGFNLSTHPVKPLVFEGPRGFSKKGEGKTEASQYYSFTRLATRGILRIGSHEIAVTGVSWMDKEFGSNQLGADKSGWDWFSLQLNDGREIMLYLLRSRSGRTDYASGTVVGSDGKPRYLTGGDWKLEATKTWTSRRTGASYPAGWKLEIPSAGFSAVITPELADQENRSTLIPDLHYWEGSVSVESPGGARIGQGYVELTGYGEKSRPPI
jgi:predicted secreted hydrolase